MLVTALKWNNRLLLELRRYYVKTAKVHPSWDIVFNPKTSRAQSIKIFRQKLSDSIDGNANPMSSPQIMATLDFLFQTLSISESSFKKSLIVLYKLILQRRISDEDIYKAISQACRKNVINLAVPKKVDGAQEPQQKPALQIRPEMNDHLGKVLKKIKICEKDQDRPITKNELFQNLEKHPDSASQSHINLESLQEYLNKAEQNKRHRKYAWEEQRRYSWDHISNNSPKLSAGKLLFAYRDIPTRRPVLKLFQRLWAPASIIKSTNDSQSRKKPEELLIYNLKRKSKIFIPASHSNSIFNINYRDLFGIINGSGRAPEETLYVIHQMEIEGWTLIGDLYDNSENVVFQRSAASPRGNNPRRFSKTQVVFMTTLLALLGYTVLKVQY